LLRRRDGFTVNGAQDSIGAARQQRFACAPAQLFGIAARLLLAQDFRAIRVGYNGSELKTVVRLLSICSNGDLAATAETPEQSPFGGGRAARAKVIEKHKFSDDDWVTRASLNPQRSLSHRRTHHFHWKGFPNALRPPETIQTSGGQNNGVELTTLQLAKACVHVSA
jgi:hypothetical protein